MSRPSTPGLFSSVFGYITREVSDFVVTAAGGEPSKAQVQANANLNVVKDGKSERKKERKRRRVQSEVQVEGEEAHDKVQKQRKRRSHDEHEQNIENAEGSQKSSRRRLSPPSPDSSRAGPSNAPEPSTSKDAEPAPAPRRRKRRSSVTMPGSFDLRSASLEPESPSEPEPESPPSPEPSTSRYVDYQIPLPPSRPSTPPSASRTSRSPQSWTPPSPRGKRVGAATRRFSNDGDPALMLPKHPHSPNHREEKGKDKALPAVFDSSSDEESSEEEDGGRASPSPRAKKNENRLGNALKRTMSVGGIERELNAVRQAHAEKEAAWEGADTTVVHDEREDFLEKIHGLEAEVMRLKAELAKASNSSFPMPPPPPPPPPPLYFRARIPTTPAPDALYAATRAQLRHAATPNEAPINPLRNSKIGKATVQLSGDKMAAFLTEVRNVRLRKVQQAPKDLERSRDFARGENLGTGLGKRKRVQEGEGEEGEDGEGEVVRRLKRRFTMAGEGAKAAFNKSRMDLDPFSRSFAFGSAPASGSSASGSASSSSGSSYASGSGNRAGFARVPSSVDGTDVTPSLASDNDAESLLLFEDRAVRTPPPPTDAPPAIAIRTLAPRQEDAILAEENHEIDDEADVDPSPFRRTFPKTPLPANARHSTTPSDSDSASPPMLVSELFDPPMSEKARGKQRASDANQGTVPGSVFTKRKPSAPLDRPTPPRARPPRRVPRASSPPPNASFDFSRREEEEEESDDDDGFGSHARASTNSSMAASTTSRASILSASTAAREEIVSKSRTARSLIPKRVYGGGNGRATKVVDEGEDGVERVEMVRPPTPPRAHQPLPSKLPAPAVKKAGLVSKGRPQTSQLPVKKTNTQQPKAHSKPALQSKPSKAPTTAPTEFTHPQDELALRRQRRQTLEQELLEAASRVPESRLFDLDLDAEMEVFQSPSAGGDGYEDVFEGKGMRGGKAFMAHGGAGGRPVRMGRGYVRGASLDDE
ncbi:hypothetical protein PENSPDRAFT_759991 [Peniophora sp. CONT]|nr:hypothetical protein PENSPDRAFT_759991 [Peniophora sp. CONT]